MQKALQPKENRTKKPQSNEKEAVQMQKKLEVPDFVFLSQHNKQQTTTK